MAGANMMFDPGSQAINAGCVWGALSGAVATPGANADLAAIRNVSATRAIGVSKVRFNGQCIPGSGTVALILALYKVTGFTAVQDTNAQSVLAQRRKTSPYDAIPIGEVSGVIATTAPMTGGTYTAPTVTAPIAAAAASNVVAANNTSWNVEWSIADLLPEGLEQDEGLLVRNIVALGAGTMQFFVGVDFFRLGSR